jgi:hypothetical protein
MKTLIIPVHSFVDLITNSSSETFICADKDTVEVFKAAITALLKVAGSDKDCDDLFTVEVTVDKGYEESDDEYRRQSVTVTAKEDSVYATEAAKYLSAIQRSFEAREVYN